MKFKLTGLEKGWILYDVGNSAFVLLISTILPIYFNYLAGNAGVLFVLGIITRINIPCGHSFMVL